MENSGCDWGGVRKSDIKLFRFRAMFKRKIHPITDYGILLGVAGLGGFYPLGLPIFLGSLQ